MHIERKYTASSQVGVDRTFWCLQCDFKCPALVLGVGSASTTSFGIGHDDGAALAAVTAAKTAAQEDAQQTFGLIPCPRCGATDATATRRFRVGGALRAVLAGLVCGFAGYIIAKENVGYMNPDAAALCAVGVGVGFAVGVVLAILERTVALYSHRGRAKLFPDQAPSVDLTRL
jgi:hypothetical protein